MTSPPARDDSGLIVDYDVDGPGTRLVVFLCGCPMRCLYCQNPDTWHKHDGTVTELADLEHLMRRYHPHRRLTGRPLAPTLEFAERLGERGTAVWVRYVLVPGFTDDPREIQEVAAFAAGLGNVERLDVLPFHKLGAGKYEQLGIRFPLADTPTPSPQLTEVVRQNFAGAGVR